MSKETLLRLQMVPRRENHFSLGILKGGARTRTFDAGRFFTGRGLRSLVWSPLGDAWVLLRSVSGRFKGKRQSIYYST